MINQRDVIPEANREPTCGALYAPDATKRLFTDTHTHTHTINALFRINETKPPKTIYGRRKYREIFETLESLYIYVKNHFVLIKDFNT